MTLVYPERLSLIIPSVHTRAGLFERTLAHLESEGYAGEIIVSDHSPASQLGVLRGVAGSHRRLKTLVLEHDPQWHFLERLVDAVECCETPYLSLHADDDFMFVDAIEACVRFLDANSGHSAAKGRMLFFDRHDRDDCKFGPHEGCARDEATPQARLLAHLANFHPTLYAVHRREQFIEAYRETLAHTRNVIFWQYLASCRTVLQGKIQVLEQPYYYRHNNPQGWRATLVREGAPDHWPMLFLAEDFSDRLREFLNGLRTALACAGVGMNDALERELKEASLWLLRRALCGEVRDGFGGGDQAFLARVATAGTRERALLQSCLQRMKTV